MTSEAFKDVMEMWDATGFLKISEPAAIAADRALDAAVRELLGEVPGCVEVAKVAASMGSRYYDVVAASGDSVEVRVSNHPARNSDAVWSFEPGDSIGSIDRGLAHIAGALARMD